ncbi:hypothetical protein [Melittangium boletus]|uniref:hypothetical protein n=1 Tax=Melittangium boletus TaxID=83453 RepID=UPI000BB32798|nr:hypothetical protein [Melittangium boletus]
MSPSRLKRMLSTRPLVGGVLLWTLVLSVLHASLNVRWDGVVNELRPESERKLDVAYIPVT